MRSSTTFFDRLELADEIGVGTVPTITGTPGDDVVGGDIEDDLGDTVVVNEAIWYEHYDITSTRLHDFSCVAKSFLQGKVKSGMK